MRDFLLGLAFMIGGGVVIAVAQTYPTMPALQFGPSLFPSLIGGGMVIGGLVLALTRVGQLKNAFAGPRSQVASYDYRGLLISLLPCALVVFYILASEFLGAALCMAASMLVLMLIRGARLWLSLLVSIIVAAAIYVLFSRYLLIPLPEGTLFSQTLTFAW
ncbi:tripartite tricarboxylate transporter TctB family protein [Salinicola sp. LHM]|uniref:tripartite tricarboxylate transporter TctB family protein n=1 Tax=Salinicola TaxID=404432 RepID=UPI000DA1F3D9|nr:MULTISPECIES: tripartite tricarboxylate transporter TctB family protein [Salinicola]MDF3919195.1 tripartite tricarboxylate transporter TctB family protein [Salinicola salarius]WQH34463.1 tripartite tricarboxylate transporter TctB family protein [Salinicola sp. LHM]